MNMSIDNLVFDFDTFQYICFNFLQMTEKDFLCLKMNPIKVVKSL